ncbi:MAG: hypothetical protein OEZ58_14155 [Gammaproteobacteria bacterium]|nr:hypothetical protein [Gammaproteobacteria bacterium]MDH5730134.1 hypothetical protein [Gammaproteobacteria bacterium]
MKLEYRKPYCEDFLCEYFRIHELSNIDELISEVKKRTEESPDYKYLVTLDDIGQASYTSMHSKMYNALDGGDWIAKEKIDGSWMDGDYLRDDLGFEQKFLIRRFGFKHGLEGVGFDDIYEKLLYLDGESREELIEANQNLVTLMDKEAYLLKVPVRYSYESIYAFPNGYFSCDLSPFENYHLAKHLEVNYDYHLFGIGASYIAFRKGVGFKKEDLSGLIDLLSKIYVKDKDEELIEFLQETIMNKQILTLRYSE